MRRRPIGQILVDKNEISETELAAALAEQERTGLRLGQILIETGRISWLALARAIAEQVLDIEAPAEPVPSPPPPVEAEPPAAATAPPPAAPAPGFLPAVPTPAPPPAAPAVLATFVPATAPVAAPAPSAAVPAPPALAAQPPVAPDLIHDPAIKLHSVEALLKERQRAFIELVTTTETLRMKVARLEEIIEERDRELTRLRVLRAS
jgi:hypothetical protein